MSSNLQKIKEIEDEIARTQKNKATSFHIGLLKAKLAKLKRDVLEESSSKGGKGGDGFDVTKSGDVRIGLVGFPSVGKSTILNKLTSTHSEVASYEFTTLTCIPGTFSYKGARIQLLDLPGIIEGATKDNRGRGRQVVSTARTCNLIFIVLDALKPLHHKRIIERELEGFGIRLNKEPPNIIFKKKKEGGINISSTVPLTNLDKDMVRSICQEYRCPSADFIFRCDATVDDVIDVIEGNRVYLPCIYIINKIDQITIEELDLLDRIPHCVPISAHHGWNIDGLLEKTWKYLDLIRVYTKPKGQLVDFTEPVILQRERRKVSHLCNRIHKGILPKFKYAWCWGQNVKHGMQKVGKDHILEDEDIIQIVKHI